MENTPFYKRKKYTATGLFTLPSEDDIEILFWVVAKI